MKLGKRVKAIRGKRGLSQGELAKRIGATRSHVANLENGHRKLTPLHVDRIAKALGTTAAFIRGS